MTLRRYGTALILSGASGTGKSTVCTQVREQRIALKFSVSCTTRAPRPGEKEGADYHFITPEIFQKHLRQGDFLEHAEVHGNFYGTLRSEVMTPILNGEDVILDIDIQGAAQIRKTAKSDPTLAACVQSLFLAPPDFVELERRLRGRGTETETVIARRLANAKNELEHWQEYDFLLINDDSQKTASNLLQLLDTLQWRCPLQQEVPFD